MICVEERYLLLITACLPLLSLSPFSLSSFLPPPPPPPFSQTFSIWRNRRESGRWCDRGEGWAGTSCWERFPQAQAASWPSICRRTAARGQRSASRSLWGSPAEMEVLAVTETERKGCMNKSCAELWDTLVSLLLQRSLRHYWRGESHRHHTADHLEDNETLSITRTLELFQRQHWKNFWETGWTAYGLFQDGRCNNDAEIFDDWRWDSICKW